MQRQERRGDAGARQAALIERLTALIERLRDRLARGDCDFAIELAEHGEWELAIQTINEASHSELLLSANERQDLTDISASLGQLAPEIAWRTVRRLVRGMFRRRGSRRTLPAVVKAEQPAPIPSEPLRMVEAMLNGPEDEVVLGRASQATLTFGVPVADPEVSGSTRVPVTLQTSRLTARHDLELESWGGGALRLAAFIDELANAWRGWSGIKEWSDDHHGARFQATHDGIGTVALDVRFEPSSGWEPPGSTIVRVVVPVDPGAFESAARFLKRHLSEADG